MESVGGKRRVVRHVGSAHDEAELGLLFAQAQRLVADDRQGELDLGLTPLAPKVSLVQARAEGALFDHPSEPKGKRLVTGPQVLKTSSRLLYEAIAGVYDEVGFDVLDDETFRDLVIARIVEPTSLLDVDRVLADLTGLSIRRFTRTLRPLRSATIAINGIVQTLDTRIDDNSRKILNDLNQGH